jgi:hypothetical protein
MRSLAGVCLMLSLAACGAGAQPAGMSPAPLDVRFVRGTGYHKSAYEVEGKTVVSFRLDVRNVGTDTGRAPSPSCFLFLEGERYDLKVFENPELAPGERGFFRTGGVIPDVTHAVFDDLEAHCAL